MALNAKPAVRLVGPGEFAPVVPTPDKRLPGETPRQFAARRHAKPFACELGVRFDFVTGPTVLTPSRVKALGEENGAARAARKVRK